MMPTQVLVASASAYRRWWYVEQLRLYGMKAATAVDGLDCIEQMRTSRPDVVLLEPSLLWGGSDGVLAVRSEDTSLQNIPVVLVAFDGVSVAWYQLAQYSLQGLLLRLPSGQELAATLLLVSQEVCGASPIPRDPSWQHRKTLSS